MDTRGQKEQNTVKTYTNTVKTRAVAANSYPNTVKTRVLAANPYPNTVKTRVLAANPYPNTVNLSAADPDQRKRNPKPKNG